MTRLIVLVPDLLVIEVLSNGNDIVNIRSQRKGNSSQIPTQRIYKSVKPFFF